MRLLLTIVLFACLTCGCTTPEQEAPPKNQSRVVTSAPETPAQLKTEIRLHIEQLSSVLWAVREDATLGLIKIGPASKAPVKAALQVATRLEIRVRLKYVLKTIARVANDRHNRNHLRSFEKDADAIHDTIDKHFFDYDWDDPAQAPKKK